MVTACASAGTATSLSTVNSTSTYPPFGVIVVTLPTGMPSTATVLPSYNPAALSNWAVTLMLLIVSSTNDQPTAVTTTAGTRAAATRPNTFLRERLTCSPGSTRSSRTASPGR